MRFPEKYKSKIETIKRAILIRSGLMSEFGNKVSLELINFDSNSNKEVTKFYELIFSLEIKGVIDCRDCAHNPGNIMDSIDVYHDKLFKSAVFHIDDNLTIKSGNSLRGILVTAFNYSWDEITNLQFEIFYDVGEEY